MKRLVLFTLAAMLASNAMLAQTPKPQPNPTAVAATAPPELAALQKEWDDLQTKTQLDYSKIRDLQEVKDYLADLQNAQVLQRRAQELQAKATHPTQPPAAKPTK